MGRKADYRLGHEAFLEYEKFIVTHPNYSGMPDLYKDDGTIQWEAPSNRGSGKFQFTNQRRRAWWATEARKHGLDPDKDTAWLSRTAKLIHPTRRKPCKKCGLEMDLRYVYPRANLVRRLLNLTFLDGQDQVDPLEDIVTLIRRLSLKYPDDLLIELPNLLRAKGVAMPAAGLGLAEWLSWIEHTYVPGEPSTLSPGAMSNAPDRLDGFHSFNLCHRGSADTGRHRDNMASYVTDRRVFELWVDGDWIAADRLMGRIRSSPQFQNAGCFYASVHSALPPNGNSTADHIGPISLGFCHRAEFQLLCSSCNSTKNNRIRVEDVQRLLAVESPQSPVVSWYAKDIWDMRKRDVVDEDTALRLSKVLRDNRYTYMKLLSSIFENGYITFLCSLLHLKYAERDVTEFANLRAHLHLTVHAGIIVSPRQSSYVTEQKARRIRVAFSSLREYTTKAARNALLVRNPAIDASIHAAIQTLLRESRATHVLDKRLGQILSAQLIREGELRNAVHRIEAAIGNDRLIFTEAREHLGTAMRLVADDLSLNWNSARYNRHLELTDF